MHVLYIRGSFSDNSPMFRTPSPGRLSLIIGHMVKIVLFWRACKCYSLAFYWLQGKVLFFWLMGFSALIFLIVLPYLLCMDLPQQM